MIMERKRTWKLVIGLVCIFFVASCQIQSTPNQATAVQNPGGTPSLYPYPYQEITPMPLYPGPDYQIDPDLLNPTAPLDAPVPQSGNASISGVIYSYTLGRALPKTNFYLTHGFGPDDKEVPPAFIGPLDGKGDIQGTSDEKGVFAIDNIPPGNYYFVVEAPYNWSVGQVSDTDPTLRLLELKPDQKYPLGIMYVSWP
jgi:hypothetical protein